MFYDILDTKRTAILPLFREFKNDFYLAGGTALALQIGHRDSYDFDFFSSQDIDTAKLFEKIKQVFEKHKILKVQDERNTLTVIIDENIKLSFFTYKYDLIEKSLDEENFRLASITDIACMKLAAITSRVTSKDYIDLYYILQDLDLDELLVSTGRKLPDLDKGLILKSLVYFDDIETEPIVFKNNREVDFAQVKSFLKEKVLEIKI